MLNVQHPSRRRFLGKGRGARDPRCNCRNLTLVRSAPFNDSSSDAGADLVEVTVGNKAHCSSPVATAHDVLIEFFIQSSCCARCTLQEAINDIK